MGEKEKDVRERFDQIDWPLMDTLKERFGAKLKYIEQGSDSMGSKPEHYDE